MNSQEVVRQHYVLRTYLKHFGHEEAGQDKIHRILRDETNPAESRQVTVAHACFQNGLYTLGGETVDERMALENYYNRSAEQNYDALRSCLVDEQAREITAELRGRILHTVATMLTRTTKVIAQSNALMDRVLANMMSMYQETGSDTFSVEGEVFSVQGKTLKEVQREFRELRREGQVLAQLRAALGLVESRRYELGILITTLDAAAGEYITSDNPVVVYGLERGPTAFYRDTSLRLPLGPKHLLCLMPDVVPELRHTIVRWDLKGKRARLDRIALNVLQWENAERWLLGSQAGLQQHVKERVALQQDKGDITPDSPSSQVAERLRELGLL